MNSKEKALELITKFRLFQSISYDEDGGRVNNYNISKHNAKQCALICVDEILNTSPIVGYDYIPIGLKPHEYWKQVKTEIEKL